MIKHVVNFSGGLCSFWAAHRVIQKHGIDGVVLLFADTMREHEDLHRFNRDACKFLGIPLTTVSKGQDPWDVCFEEKMIANSRVPLCSIRLKRELLHKWTKMYCDPGQTTLHFGISWDEAHRLEGLRKRYPDWKCEAPMCDAPLWDKDQMIDALKGTGIELPVLYKLGYVHNNCSGRCFASGHAQWALALQHDRKGYLDDEEKEQQFIKLHGNRTILKDRRNKETRPLSLREFRARVEGGKDYDKTDFGGCGCSVMFDKDETEQEDWC